MLTALELGADDVREEDDSYEVITSPEVFMEVKEGLEGQGIKLEDADVVMLPENTVEINDADTAARVIKLIDLLEDHDDVQNVYTNMSISDEILEQIE